MIYLGNLNYLLEWTKSFLLQYINKIKFCFYNELLSLIKMNLMPGRMYYACPHNSESGGWNISSIWRIGGCSTYIDRYHAGTHWIPKKVKNDNPLTDSSGQKQTLHPCNMYTKDLCISNKPTYLWHIKYAINVVFEITVLTKLFS